jgi:hypothetical protein
MSYGPPDVYESFGARRADVAVVSGQDLDAEDRDKTYVGPVQGAAENL